MSHPTDSGTPRSESLAPEIPRSSAPPPVPTPLPLAHPRIRAIDALRRPTTAPSVPVQPSSIVLPFPAPQGVDGSLPPRPRIRAIDALRGLPQTSHKLSFASVPPTTAVSPSLAPHGLDFNAVTPPPAQLIPSTQIPNPVRARTHPRALDLLKGMSSTAKSEAPEPSLSEPRPHSSPSSRPSKRRRLRLPSPEVIELSDSDPDESDVIEILESDEESDPLAKRRSTETPEFDVLNTNHLLQTRTTVRDWLSDDDFAAWVISREEFHSEQVDRDMTLPASLNDLSSSYVRPLHFCFHFFNMLVFPGYLRR